MNCCWKHLLHTSIALILALGILVAGMGCPKPSSTKHSGQEPLTRGDTNGPRRHAWDALTDMFAEKVGYGMYTYVLFGRRLTPAAGLAQDTRERYENLLKAIHASTLTFAEVGDVDRQETNLILIPATAMVDEPTLRNYHAVLAKRYLALLSGLVQDSQPELADRLITRQGPFLISTPKALGDVEPDQAMFLYADLSTTSAAAMPEIVAEYKRRLKKGVGSVERFGSLRLALLDFILDVDDNLRIVKSALAADD